VEEASDATDAAAAVAADPAIASVRRCPYIAGRYGAIREVFEEVAVPIVRGLDADVARGVSSARAEVVGQRATFAAACAALRVQPALDRLRPWSRWITPVQEKRRFDTRFWLLCFDGNRSESDALAQRTAAADEGEVFAMQWLTPSRALDLYAAQTVTLAPPTWYTVRQLRDAFASFESLRDARSPHAVVATTPAQPTPTTAAAQADASGDAERVFSAGWLPEIHMLPSAGELAIVLPGDTRYGTAPERFEEAQAAGDTLHRIAVRGSDLAQMSTWRYTLLEGVRAR